MNGQAASLGNFGLPSGKMKGNRSPGHVYYLGILATSGNFGYIEFILSFCYFFVFDSNRL